MKNRIITYILLGVLGVLPLTSCSDYLDKMPDDQLTLENVFSNRGNLERWLSYLYSVMPEFYIYDGPDAIGDELAPSVGWESQGFKAIQYQNGNWTPISPGVVTYWDKYPKAIRQAYTLIKYAHPLSDVSEKEINYMKAECRFFHCLLPRYDGDDVRSSSYYSGSGCRTIGGIFITETRTF